MPEKRGSIAQSNRVSERGDVPASSKENANPVSFSEDLSIVQQMMNRPTYLRNDVTQESAGNVRPNSAEQPHQHALVGHVAEKRRIYKKNIQEEHTKTGLARQAAAMEIDNKGFAEKLYVGDRVEVTGRKGTVMFIGPAQFAGGRVVAGLRLDEKRATSTCDGKYNGERLFRCKAGFGIIAPLEDVNKLTESDLEPLPGLLIPFCHKEACDPIIAVESLVGHEHAKSKIQAVVNALQVNRRRVAAGAKAEPAPHIVLAGPSGSGKSLLAQLLSRIISNHDVSRHGPLINASKSDLMAIGRSPGRTTELVTQHCEKAEGGVLFIDDFHRMLPTGIDAARDSPGLEAIEALAVELDRRARRPNRYVVLVLAGDADGIASARRMCPQFDAMLPQPILLPNFSPSEIVTLIDRMATERGFTLAAGLKNDPMFEHAVAEAERCAARSRKNAHLARALLEQAIDRQTERVFTLGTLGKDSLTILEKCDFITDDSQVRSRENESNTAYSASALRMQQDTATAIAELENIVGLKSVKEFIMSLRAQLLVEKERVAAGLPSTGGGVLHMIFTGNPGTGKTTVARIVANLMRALGVIRRGHLVEADRSSLVAGYSGQTALKTKSVVQEALGGVLFVDEAYALVSGENDSFGKEALDTLMKEMEDHREDLVVIAAGYVAEMRALLAANPGLESRFPTTLHFADYSPVELMKIAERVLEPQKMKFGSGAKELLMSFFEAEVARHGPEHQGSNGRGVRNLLEAVKRAQALRLAQIETPKSVNDLITISREDCEIACTHVKQ